MGSFFKAWHLRLASKAVAELLHERPDCKQIKVHADEPSRSGYSIIEFLTKTPKGKLQTHKFVLHFDAHGRRMVLVKGHAYTPGKAIDERVVPGDMVFPLAQTADAMLAAYGASPDGHPVRRSTS